MKKNTIIKASIIIVSFVATIIGLFMVGSIGNILNETQKNGMAIWVISYAVFCYSVGASLTTEIKKGD